MQRVEPDKLYPFLFEPIYKEVMWGGTMLSSVLHRDIPKTKEPVGESWEIVDRTDAVSIVENGFLKGTSFRDLLESSGGYVVGNEYKGGRFPLLVKLIDAGERLSLQVHPDSQTAKKIPGAEPKAEMWYIVDAKKGAKIYAGLNHKTTKMRFLDTYMSSKVEECLTISNSVQGDAYYINAGTVHAIGEGNLLLEIQQNSNTTFRISDWGRVGLDGKPRELHIEEALESIHFTSRTSSKISGVIGKTEHNRKFPIIQNSKYFKIDDLKLISSWSDATKKDSFHIITPINEDVILTGANGFELKIDRCRSCLIPAVYGEYAINVKNGINTTVIKTQIQ